MTTQPVHTLYRFFDASGVLLYVGRTVDARSRFRTHERSKEWFHTVARIDRQIYPTAEKLAAAEVAAIRSEDPLHNVQHSTREPALKIVRDDDEDSVDDRILKRQTTIADIWDSEIQQKACKSPEPTSGCECAVCIEEVFAELDNIRLEHYDDSLLVKAIDALEDEYLAGAEPIDWFYDLDDVMRERRWGLQTHSVTNPAPAFASIENGLIRIGCPFCSRIHEHYLVSGAAVDVLDAPCLGTGRYLPVFDFIHASESARNWIQGASA